MSMWNLWYEITAAMSKTQGEINPGAKVLITLESAGLCIQ